jgi:SAM-dependent methyltransferase
MSFDTAMAACQRLSGSMEALAAVGAHLRLQQANATADPRVRGLLDEVARAVEPSLLDGTSAGQQQIILSFIQAFFRQAADLLENPTRPPGWSYEDPVVLQAQGLASRLVVGVIEACAKQQPELKAVLGAPGAFLDIGSGVGWLAIEAAKSWPAMKVVAVDPWEPAMRLARKNIADTGTADRIELRAQSIEQMTDRDAFTLAWFAGPFIPREIATDAMTRMYRAMKPGGFLVFGLYGAAPTPLAQALVSLRVVRGGGHPWTVEEATSVMTAAGFTDVAPFRSETPILLVVGRKPG